MSIGRWYNASSPTETPLLSRTVKACESDGLELGKLLCGVSDDNLPADTLKTAAVYLWGDVEGGSGKS